MLMDSNMREERNSNLDYFLVSFILPLSANVLQGEQTKRMLLLIIFD